MPELFVKLSGSWMVVEMPSEPSSFCGTNFIPHNVIRLASFSI